MFESPDAKSGKYPRGRWGGVLLPLALITMKDARVTCIITARWPSRCFECLRTDSLVSLFNCCFCSTESRIADQIACEGNMGCYLVRPTLSGVPMTRHEGFGLRG